MFLATWTERGGTEENASEQRVGVEDEHGKYATSAVGQYSEASTVLKTDTARPVTPSHLEIALSRSRSLLPLQQVPPAIPSASPFHSGF